MTNQEATSLVELAACPEHRREQPATRPLLTCASRERAEYLRDWYAGEFPQVAKFIGMAVEFLPGTHGGCWAVTVPERT